MGTTGGVGRGVELFEVLEMCMEVFGRDLSREWA